MTPLITIQILGLIHKLKSRHAELAGDIALTVADMYAEFNDNEIIDL